MPNAELAQMAQPRLKRCLAVCSLRYKYTGSCAGPPTRGEGLAPRGGPGAPSHFQAKPLLPNSTDTRTFSPRRQLLSASSGFCSRRRRGERSGASPGHDRSAVRPDSSFPNAALESDLTDSRISVAARWTRAKPGSKPRRASTSRPRDPTATLSASAPTAARPKAGARPRPAARRPHASGAILLRERRRTEARRSRPPRPFRRTPA